MDAGIGVSERVREQLIPYPEARYPHLRTDQFEGKPPMHTTYLVVTLAAAAANAGIAVADFARADFVLANSAEVGVARRWIPWLATLKLAGAGGLLLGLLGMREVGLAAGVGLVLFFAGALLTHLRARVYYNLAFPGAYFALAVAATALAATA